MHSRLDITNGKIELAHGAGGRASSQLITQLFKKHFDNALLAQNNDQAVFEQPVGRLAMSVDSFVVSPLFFPGGDIGKLAVFGTVNDLAMGGAAPLYLTVSFILEEGLPLADLEKIVISMAAAAAQTGVKIIAGDTKVVERGKGDGVFITTTGLGRVPTGLNMSGDQARPGDVIILSGSLGDHGIAIMSQRENLQFETQIESDCASLFDLVAQMLKVTPGIRCMRDPSRGGLATTLNELAQQSQVGMLIHEEALPIKDQVQAACELLGLDPLYVANEGKLVCICAAGEAQLLLETMRKHVNGRDAAIIGEVIEDAHAFVQMKTQLGGYRLVDWLSGEQLPRIC
ncbi:MAG TPA: hydrogenase expression/formation protein HypE [Pseudomonadales bacterium]|nr:hydrogenase expression/formation protein HypE [Pseudomonadales bacterium]